MTDRKWRITIPRWDGEGGFQHYKHRDPIWLRVYTRLHSDDDYLELSAHLRGVLLGLWIEYARSGRDLAVTTATLTRRLNARVTTQDLQRLNQAGFIEIALAPRKQDAPLEQNRTDQKPKAVLTALPGGGESDETDSLGNTFENILKEMA